MGYAMRAVLLTLLAVSIVGCAEDKVDMSSMKSPQAGAPIKNLGTSKKPEQSPYRVVKGGTGTGLVLK